MKSDGEKKPLFFRDEGEVGDVLTQAKELLAQSKGLEMEVKKVEEATKEYADLVEEAKYKVGVLERLGKSASNFKNKILELTKNWDTKKERELKEKEQEIIEKQRELEKQRAEMEAGLESSGKEQEATLANELEKIKMHSETVSHELEKLNETKEILNDILSKNEEEITDSILNEEDIRFLSINYSNLVKTRLNTNSWTNPVTSKDYTPKDWHTKVSENMISSTIKEGILHKACVRLMLEYLVPPNEEGFVYQKVGPDVLDKIMDVLQKEKDENELYIHIYASPTGWTQNVVSRVKDIYDANTCIFLVDLMNRTVIYNQDDDKNNVFADWFSPYTIQEEVKDLQMKIDEEIEAKTLQFRADKVAKKYGVPRKVVVATFNRMEKEKAGEIIGKDEGAKDIIFFAGGV